MSERATPTTIAIDLDQPMPPAIVVDGQRVVVERILVRFQYQDGFKSEGEIRISMRHAFPWEVRQDDLLDVVMDGCRWPARAVDLSLGRNRDGDTVSEVHLKCCGGPTRIAPVRGEAAR